MAGDVRLLDARHWPGQWRCAEGMTMMYHATSYEGSIYDRPMPAA